MRIRQLAPDNSTRSNLLRCSTENNYLGGNRRFVVPASCVQSAMCPKAVFSGAFSCVVGRPEHLDQAAQLLEVDVARAGCGNSLERTGLTGLGHLRPAQSCSGGGHL